MNSPSQPESGARQRGALRRPALILLTLVALCAGLAAGAWWLWVGRYAEDTDDAYVGARVVNITPLAGGTVVAVGADENDHVNAGQVLLRLDPADARIELDAREAQLGQAVRETRALFADNGVLQANVALREAELARAEDDLARRRAVRESGVVSEEEVRHAEVSATAARAALQSAREQLQVNRANTSGTTVATHPRVLGAAARVREAFLAARRGEVLAPVTGQIARRNVQVGQRLNPGTPALVLVPLDNLWVDANFKEGQLENLRIGQSAEVTADAYGSHVRYRGHVIGLGAGTGSAFALLPAQNATGNWIKVVQRVPVRIALDPADLKAHPLRVGLSTRVVVDIHDRSGPLVGTHDDNAPDNRTAVYDPVAREADARVAQIVAANLAGEAPARAR
jgi:membrane fusion protein (multidrug efflux system)